MRRSHPVFFAGLCGFIFGCSVALILRGLIELQMAGLSHSSWQFALQPWLVVTLWPLWYWGTGNNGEGGILRWLFVMSFAIGGNGLIFGGIASVIVGTYLGVRSLFDKEARRPISIKPK